MSILNWNYPAIHCRLKEDFITIKYRKIKGLSTEWLNDYSGYIGVDTLLDFARMEETTNILDNARIIWMPKYLHFMCRYEKFIVLLFGNGDFLMLHTDIFKEITDFQYSTSKLFIFGDDQQDLILLRDKENFNGPIPIYGNRIYKYQFSSSMFFNQLFKFNLASYIDNPYSYKIIYKIMSKNFETLFDKFGIMYIIHSEVDGEFIFNAVGKTYQKLLPDIKKEFLLSTVFSKRPSVHGWKSTDNTSKYDNMYVVECPIVGDRESALQKIHDNRKDIIKYCKNLLMTSKITSDIYKFLVLDRSVYSADGILLLYYCYKGDDKMVGE